MAITYLSGQRIQGVSANSSSSWTSNTADWTYSSSGYLDFATIHRSTTSQEIYLDLQDFLGGSNLSDSSWVVRLGKFTTGTLSSGNVLLYIGFTNNNGADSGETQQTIVTAFNFNSSAGAINVIGTADSIESGDEAGTVYSDLDASTDYYVEMKRDGNDFTVTAYSDEYSTSLGTQTITKSGLSGLRYFKAFNNSEQSGNSATGSKFYGDVQIYDAQTSATTLTKTITLADDKATLVTATEVVADQDDGWGNFDQSGSAEYCYYNDSGAGQEYFKFLHDGSAFSISMWIYRDGNQSGQTEPNYLGDNATSTSDIGFALFNYNTSGGLRYFISNGTALTTAIDTTIADTTWTNIIITYGGSAGTITMYKDGVSVGTFDASSYSFSSSNPTQQLGFMSNLGRGSYINGRLSMVALWKDHALSADDITKLSGGRRPTVDGLGFDYSSSNIRNLWFYDSQTDDEIGSETNPNLTLANAFGRVNWVGSQASAPTSSGAVYDYSSNLPTGTQFEQTTDRKFFQLSESDGWVERGTAI